MLRFLSIHNLMLPKYLGAIAVAVYCVAAPSFSQSMVGGKARALDDASAIISDEITQSVNQSTSQDAAAPVQTAPTEGLVTCLLTPARVANIASGRGGLVAEVAVKRADFVQKGQLLVQLDDRPANSDLKLARIAMETLREKVARSEKLVATRMISVDEIEGLRADFAAAQAQYERAQLEVDLTRITAPFSGVIADANVEAGEVLSTVAFMQLIDISTLQVEMVFARGSFGSLSVGQTMTIGVDLVSRSVPAVVTAADPFLDASSNTFSVLARIENADLSLPAGANCTVEN